MTREGRGRRVAANSSLGMWIWWINYNSLNNNSSIPNSWSSSCSLSQCNRIKYRGINYWDHCVKIQISSNACLVLWRLSMVLWGNRPIDINRKSNNNSNYGTREANKISIWAWVMRRYQINNRISWKVARLRDSINLI